MIGTEHTAVFKWVVANGWILSSGGVIPDISDFRIPCLAGLWMSLVIYVEQGAREQGAREQEVREKGSSDQAVWPSSVQGAHRWDE